MFVTAPHQLAKRMNRVLANLGKKELPYHVVATENRSSESGPLGKRNIESEFLRRKNDLLTSSVATLSLMRYAAEGRL